MAASLQRRIVPVTLEHQIEGVRALRRQPATASVNARRHFGFSDRSRRGMAEPFRGLFSFAGHQFFHHQKI
jgi:hypothetical protein